MEVTSPAQLAPSLTRYRIHRFTSGYFHDEYGHLSVVCCCCLSVDGLETVVWRCTLPHLCRLRWPALRVPIPGRYQWSLRIFFAIVPSNWSHVRWVVSFAPPPSQRELPTRLLLRSYRHLMRCLVGWSIRLELGPGVSWVLAPA